MAKEAFPDRSIEKKGRPPKLTERDKQYCVRQVTTGGKETAVDVAKPLKEDLGVSVHVDTVRNALHEKGLGAIVKPKKPYLSPKNVKERLEWAKTYKDFTKNDWRRVIWSEETKINQFWSDGRKYATTKRSNHAMSRKRSSMAVAVSNFGAASRTKASAI